MFSEKQTNESKSSSRCERYDGKADYRYNDLGNYDSIEVSTRGKKEEVKAEVVDHLETSP